ncbi:MAG: hypothetical protein QM759_10750 [Terricaulis sp.]
MHRLFLAACATLVLSAGAALAQPAPGGGPGAMIAQADTNHDGNITRAEWDAARAARFTQQDANHDGQLSGDERPHWGDHPPPPAGGPPPGGGEHHRMNPDTNNDGNISRAEFDAQSTEMFNHLDADHNGTISAAELQAMRDRMHDH